MCVIVVPGYEIVDIKLPKFVIVVILQVETGLKAAAPEDHEAGLSTRVAGEDSCATEALLDFFFFFSWSTVEGSEGAKGNSISATEGGEEATGEAGGKGSIRSDEGSDPNRAPEEDEADSLDIFSKKKR